MTETATNNVAQLEEKSCQACGRYTKAWRMVMTATGRKQRRCTPCADRVHKPGAWLRIK